MSINTTENSINERDGMPSENASAVVDDDSISTPLMTLFAIPKPFGSATDQIQMNAIRSWARLAPKVEVILLGDDEPMAAFAQGLGIRHFPNIRTNEFGTPLVSSGFEIAKRESNSPVLLYCNSDVILEDYFVDVIENLYASELAEFVAFGRRIDATVEQEIDFDSKTLVHDLRSLKSRWRQVLNRLQRVFRVYK